MSPSTRFGERPPQAGERQYHVEDKKHLRIENSGKASPEKHVLNPPLEISSVDPRNALQMFRNVAGHVSPRPRSPPGGPAAAPVEARDQGELSFERLP